MRVKINAPGRLAANRAGLIPWWTSDEDGASGNFPLLDHFQDNSSSLASFALTHQTLGYLAWFKSVGIDSEATNVGVRGDEVEPFQVPTFRNGYHRLRGSWALEQGT